VSKALDIDIKAWHKAIESQVKPQFVELNLKAFEYGRNLV
jgi:Pyruvate/2-oxoacid:ferredoxin oxidoreductase gamma subunit